MLISPAIAADHFTVRVGANKVFTQFNHHNTWYENCTTDPGPDVCALDPAIPESQSAYSEDNVAYVYIDAQKGSNGGAYGEVGIRFNIDYAEYSPDDVINWPVKVTIDFSYLIQANYIFGSSDGEIRIAPYELPWFDIIGLAGNGTKGIRGDHIIKTYETTLAVLIQGITFLVRSHAHTGNDAQAVFNSHSSSTALVNSIRVEFDPSVDPCECDLNQDGKCNILDYQEFIQDWGRTDCPL